MSAGCALGIEAGLTAGGTAHALSIKAKPNALANQKS
jgi:hypothetical protein